MLFPRKLWPFLFWWSSAAFSAAATPTPERPNILWITSEDHGPEMGCYGDALARTPNVDRLAAKGMRFDVAWSTAPVCAPARTAILTGLYPSSSGGLHMRSMVSLPPQFQTYPEFLRSAGYYCTNNLKEDYNVLTPADLWHESSRTAHWRNRRAGQPFFAVFNSTKSHESQIRTRPHQAITDPARVRVPAYHPDTPEVRQDWAQYYDKVSEADADAGVVLREIAQAGLADDTIVFYYGDHGNGMPRGKRWPSNSGLRVPLVVYFPLKWQHLAPAEYAPGGLSERRVSFVDLAPTLLSLVGIQPPEWMQGHAFAGPHQVPGPQYLYGERGRMDERLDLVRSVTDGRYVYLRNYYPHVSQGQRVAYQFQTPTTRIWRETFDRGDATPAQSIFWQIPKAPEELYDLQNDPDEVHNLAGSTEHRAVLERLRQAQREHLRAIRDVMFLPEGEMFARGAGEAPYTLARDPQRYPLERVVATAELASSLRAEDTLKLVGLADDKDSAVRYWAVTGLLMRGEDGVRSAPDLLRARLQDASPFVRVSAAEALLRYGATEARGAALETLRALLEPKEQDVFVAMAALSAVEAAGPEAAALHPLIFAQPAATIAPHERFEEYVPRLRKNIEEVGVAAPVRR
jgi:arylsulfatase A-like enzyme